MFPRPCRIQRKRTKGWRLPVWAVCVTRPGVLGNPFTGPNAVAKFEEWLEEILKQRSPGAMERQVIDRMRAIAASSMSVACFCPLDKPCHGDVILKMARRIRAGWPAWVTAEQFRGTF